MGKGQSEIGLIKSLRKRFTSWIHYQISAHGHSPLRILIWIFVTGAISGALLCFAPNDHPINAFVYMTSMTSPPEPDWNIFTIIGILDGIIGLVLISYFVAVVTKQN